MAKDNIVLAVVGGIGGTVVTVFLVILCYWCYKRRKEGEIDVEGSGYQTFSSYEPVPQKDGNSLSKQSSAEESTSGKYSPFLTRKTIK